MSQVKLTADTGGGTTSIKGPAQTTGNADVVFKLPIADGSSGEVLKTDGSGQLSFTSNAGTTINNNADNRVITGSGTANTLNGESNVVIDSSGRLLLGTTSASGISSNADDLVIGSTSDSTVRGLTLASTTNANIRFADDGDNATGMIEYNHSSNFMRFYVEAGERMRITASGNVGINTDSPSHSLEVNGNISLGNGGGSGGSEMLRIFNDGGVERIHGTNNPSALAFGMGGTSSSNEAFRIDSSGRVGIGTTTTNNPDVGDGGLQIRPNHTNGAPDVHFTRASSSNTSSVVGFVNGNVGVGSITYNNGGTSFNTSSDYRLKENVVAISDGITRLKTLKPSRFNFIDDETNTLRDGFIAHEVTPVVPEAITGEKDAVDSNDKPIYQGIDQAKLVPLLTAALQEAVGKIEVLETKVAALEAA
tara:strand:+ start:272 stop:1534 length:1263 start_codon:yes stop_codon:yes gene_type:complete